MYCQNTPVFNLIFFARIILLCEDKIVDDRRTTVLIKIANYLVLIIVITVVISLVMSSIMVSNKSDTELINVTGSLREQSYRLLYEMEYDSKNVDQSLQQYRSILYSSCLERINHEFWATEDVKLSYRTLADSWVQLEKYITNRDVDAYRLEIVDYVETIDKFVRDLQDMSERKRQIAFFLHIFRLILIVLMISYIIWFLKKEVMNPLDKLIFASTQIKLGQFDHIPLDTDKNNEIGRLSLAFTQMAKQLRKFYLQLENSVDEKTREVHRVNRSLSMLYRCSQLVTTNNLSTDILSQVLKEIMVHENLPYIELVVYDIPPWHIVLGEKKSHCQFNEAVLKVGEQELGMLYWNEEKTVSDQYTMQSTIRMLARLLYVRESQRNQKQLFLMEERSIIARELHDSLAQVLAYLKLQIALLKNSMQKDNADAKQKSLLIIKDFERVLNDGYAQLRELLSTFRLTVQEANLQLALEQVIDSLRNCTSMNITLDCSLPSHTFDALQLVNVLQIIREAVLNAIKHSQGTLIEIIGKVNNYGEYELIVRDNGIGIASLDEPKGHFGLNIMYERSVQLDAVLTIEKLNEGGTEVKLTLPNTLSA